MSTYLVAFVVSKFGNEVSPSDLANNNVTFRIWARKDALDQIGKSNLQLKNPIQDGEFRMNTVVEFQSEVGVIQCSKCSANPIRVTPIWKQLLANREHPIRGLYRICFEIFFSNFGSHMKDSKWGRKCIFMNRTSKSSTNPITATPICK